MQTRFSFSRQPYLRGKHFIEADWRLFTILARFDSVCVRHLKCDIRCLVDCSDLSDYVPELYQIREFVDTINFEHIKRHYYQSRKNINPSGIVSVALKIDLM